METDILEKSTVGQGVLAKDLSSDKSVVIEGTYLSCMSVKI